MEKSFYLSATFNNVVFAGRNKAYGAYALRRTYSKNMAFAAIIASVVFSGAFVGPLIETILFAGQEKYVRPVYTISKPLVIEMPNLPKPPVQPEKKTAAALPTPEEKAKTEKFVAPNVVEENTQLETSTIPEQNLLSKVQIGKNTLEGELPEFSSAMPDDMPPPGLGTGTGEPVALPTEFIHVEDMPEFAGGDEALFAYLGNKMRYPKAAQRAGVEGVVVVTFVVAADGTITKAKVVKGLGYGTEEEALRVINSMPAWQPGKQNGRAVPVRYTLPIRFSLR